MSVKPSSTAAKVLTVLDAVARNQPIGVSELARMLDEDKSLVQRMLVTLASERWIWSEPGRSTKWRVTQRMRLLADLACPDDDLRERARPAMEALRDATGETVSLVVRDVDRFLVADVAESEMMLRTVPRIGGEVPGPVSASSLAFLPFLPRPDQAAILGSEPGERHEEQFRAVREAGFAVLESERGGGTVSLAAPVFGAANEPLAAIVLSAPVARLAGGDRAAAGKQVRDTADGLSVR